MARLKITETVLCGAQKALTACRMPISDVLPSLKLIDAANYYSCEVLNRDIYRTAIEFLKEDPWERLRTFAKNMPNTKLQMSFAGQYLLGERLFPEDVVEYFIKHAASNGIGIMRIFDPLNDINNLILPIKIARGVGVHVQAAVTYTDSFATNTVMLLNFVKKLEQYGADSICIKDNAELLNPYTAYSLIASVKNEVSIPVQFSTPNSTGLGYMNTIKVVEAGVDMIDTAISPFAEGASYPATEAIVTAFAGSPYDSGLKLENLYRVEEFFSKLQDKYLSSGVLSIKSLVINPFAGKTKLPDETIGYLFKKLKNSYLGQVDSIIQEIEKVKTLAGNPPLVFPIYMGIIDQAIINASSEKPFDLVSDEFVNIVNGSYGNTPDSIDPVFKDSILKNQDLYSSKKLEPELEMFKSELPDKFNEQPEDVLTLAQFPDIAPVYFEARSDRLYDIDSKHSDKLNHIHPI